MPIWQKRRWITSWKIPKNKTLTETTVKKNEPHLRMILDTLTPREKRVLELRYGLEDGRARTLEEVGQEFNVTRERIRQIEAKALRKLRNPRRGGVLQEFLK